MLDVDEAIIQLVSQSVRAQFHIIHRYIGIRANVWVVYITIDKLMLI